MSRSGTDNQPLPFPPRATLVAPPAPPTNLPAPLTAFIGRQAATAIITALLTGEQTRLLTLTGPGGVGKTRLALEVAHRLREQYAGGVFLVRLAPLSDPDLVLPAIAQVLDVTESGGTAQAENLAAALRDRQLLLVLDNFEQVLAAGPAVAALLAAAPGLQALVTSRTPLAVYGEREFSVAPLDAPDAALAASAAPAQLATFEAVQLLVARARDARPEFALTADNAVPIAAICRRLDGLPLALELAAARLRLFAPAALLTRLERRLPLLTGGAVDLPTRQQTLRNTIAWSYDLLTADEQGVFTRLAVFPGGATFAAIAAVAAPPDLAPEDLLAILDSLARQNLLRQRAEEDGEPRFSMLATIHEYAQERLVESGEQAALQRRHAEFFLQRAEANRTALRGPAQATWFARWERDHDNVRAALGWALAGGEAELALRLGFALWRFWFGHGHMQEGRQWLESGVVAAHEAPAGITAALRAQVLNVLGTFASAQTDYAQAARYYQESLALRRDLGDSKEVANTLTNLAILLYDQGEYTRARALYEESLALFRELGDQEAIADALSNLGTSVLVMADPARAQALYEESLALRRELGDKWGVAVSLLNLSDLAEQQQDYGRAQVLQEESLALFRELADGAGIATALNNLGSLALEQHDPVRATALQRESLALFWELGDKRGTIWCLDSIARIASQTGHWARAVRLVSAGQGLRTSLGIPPQPRESATYDRLLAAARAHLAEAAYAAAWAGGLALTLPQAVALAQQEPDPAPPLAGPGAAPPRDALLDLSERERDVLRLVAAGLTNKEIAARLSLSPRTVQAHLYRIFGKLDVTTRSAATRYALDHGLV